MYNARLAAPQKALLDTFYLSTRRDATRRDATRRDADAASAPSPKSSCPAGRAFVNLAKEQIPLTSVRTAVLARFDRVFGRGTG